MKQASLLKVVGENSAQVNEKRSDRKLKENIKAPEEGSIKSWFSQLLQWCACCDIFYLWVYILRQEPIKWWAPVWDYCAHRFPIWSEYQTFQRNGAWAEREQEEGLSFLFSPSIPALLESLILRSFYVWCPLISNLDPTVQLLQPLRHARTGYKSWWSWIYEWYTYEKKYCWYDSVKNLCKKRNSCNLSDQIRQSTGNL